MCETDHIALRIRKILALTPYRYLHGLIIGPSLLLLKYTKIVLFSTVTLTRFIQPMTMYLGTTPFPNFPASVECQHDLTTKFPAAVGDFPFLAKESLIDTDRSQRK